MKDTERGLNTTFEPLRVEEQIGYLFKVVQTALRDVMDSALADLEISTPEYAALTVVDRLPDISKADLARHCFVRPQSMTRMLAHMIETGLIIRSAHPRHGRILQTRLTDEGSRRLALAHAAVTKIVTQMLEGVDPVDRALFRDLLLASRDGLASLRQTATREPQISS
jgi:DNA-binding MarR family transcriptional regulator